MMGEPLTLEVLNLGKTYRRAGASRRETGSVNVALTDVTFSIAPGESVALVGESGSGKSTIARILAGLETQSTGTVRVLGKDRPVRRTLSASVRRHRAREIQMVFQDPFSSLDPRQRVLACIEEVVRLHESSGDPPRRTVADHWLTAVGIPSSLYTAYAARLSGGEAQRVAIARALTARPRVLILDEAVASLDVSVQAQILNLLSDIREQEQLAYLFISHSLAVVRQVADRTIVLRHGEIVEQGETSHVLAQPASDYARRLLLSEPDANWAQLAHRAAGGRGERGNAYVRHDDEPGSTGP